MKKIFIDSSFFIAILHRGDQYHKEEDIADVLTFDKKDFAQFGFNIK